MLKLVNPLRTSILFSKRFFASHTNESSVKEKWDILSSVCLERLPVITRDLNDLEETFQKLLLEIEYERSYKSNFELRVESDKKRAKTVKEGNVSITEMDSFPQQTSQDFLDASVEELNAFKFADRKSNDTIENNSKSLKRSLDRHLLLLVKENIGKNPQWVLPQGENKSGETLRESAERILQEKCGKKIETKFLGNAPIGFYKYRYPKAVRTNDSVGAKIFFFKAQMLQGDVDLNKERCSDYMWAKRTELEVLPLSYLRSVKMFLIDEEH